MSQQQESSRGSEGTDQPKLESGPARPRHEGEREPLSNSTTSASLSSPNGEAGRAHAPGLSNWTNFREMGEPDYERVARDFARSIVKLRMADEYRRINGKLQAAYVRLMATAHRLHPGGSDCGWRECDNEVCEQSRRWLLEAMR